jgi:hypothetical protein
MSCDLHTIGARVRLARKVKMPHPSAPIVLKVGQAGTVTKVYRTDHLVGVHFAGIDKTLKLDARLVRLTERKHVDER